MCNWSNWNGKFNKGDRGLGRKGYIKQYPLIFGYEKVAVQKANKSVCKIVDIPISSKEDAKDIMDKYLSEVNQKENIEFSYEFNKSKGYVRIIMVE